VVSLALGLGASVAFAPACASSTPSGLPDGGGDDTIDAAPTIDASGELDAGVVYPPPGDGTSFCAAGGSSQNSANGSVRHYSCVGPVDLAARPARLGTSDVWQPGPIFRTSP
jgi:hypothetical protein